MKIQQQLKPLFNNRMKEIITIEKIQNKGQSLDIIKPINNLMPVDELVAYLNKKKADIRGLLLESGAILFRGFSIKDKDDFLKVKQVFSKDSKFDYVDGNSPRIKLSADIYTSTEYPKEYSISLHNELSYTDKWPELIFFFCHVAPSQGGETPIIDCRMLLKELGSDITQKFEQFGVQYTRYLLGKKGMGKTWMDTFETDDKKQVERHCVEHHIDYSWDDDNLLLKQIGAGVAEHPLTGEKVWFNQANQFHPSNLPEDIYKMLSKMFADKKHKFPQYAYYGNGEEIPEQTLKFVTSTQFEKALIFQWEPGDLLILDNMLMAHGRMPFSGDRKIFVSMC